MSEKNTQKEISLKEVILALIEWFHFIRIKYKPILIVGAICGILGFINASFKVKVYEAEMTFALEEKKGGMNSLGGLASQFGFDMGSSDGAFSGDNILDILKSRIMIENTLLTEVTIDGKKDLLINRYIKQNELDKAWEESDKDYLKTLKFTPNQDRSQFNEVQDSVLKVFYADIVEGNLRVERKDKKLSIVVVSLKSTDQLFAKAFVEILTANVSEFYIDTKTHKMKTNIVILQNRVDSVKQALDREMYGAAVSQDQNLNPSKAQVRVSLNQKQLNIQLLTTLYGELLKNLEISKLTLLREEPLIMLIDKPLLPLKFTKPSRLFSLIGGGFVGVILAMFYFTIRRMLKNIMTPEQE